MSEPNHDSSGPPAPQAPSDDDGIIADLTPPTQPRKRPSEKLAATLRPPTSGAVSAPASKPEEPTRQPDDLPPSSPVPPTRPRISDDPTTVRAFHRAPNTKVLLPIERANLENEKILRDARRVIWDSVSCPSLGGIPLLAKLGEGGMGAVYFGVHPRLSNAVAVKVLPDHLAEKDPTLVDRFVREAQIAANVRSPHLVHVIDVNQDAGLYFLVMEYVCGQTGAKLLAQLRKTGQTGLTQVQAIDTCIAAAVGLKAAHNFGVIHRDIKPDNIIIPYSRQVTPGAPGEPNELTFSAAKLMDLGLARVQSSGEGLTVAQSTMGTPGYMAPEQSMDAKTADQRSDVFSMGATLYALLAGRSPFQRESQMKTLFATVHEAPTPLSNHRTDVHPRIVEVLERSMAKDPSMRYPGIDAFLTELCMARDKVIAGVLSSPKPQSGRSQSHETDLVPKPARPESKKQPSGGGVSVEFVRATRVAPAPAPATDTRWKSRQFAAIGAAVLFCAVLLGGTALVVMRRPAISPQELLVYRAEHADHIRDARAMADSGDFMKARTKLGIAMRIGLDEPQARQAEADAQSYIANAEHAWTSRYQQQLVAFDSIIESQALENAPAALQELKKYAPPDGSDDKLIATKEAALNDLKTLREHESAVAKDLEEVAALDPTPALMRLGELRVALKDPSLKPSKSLAALDKRYRELFDSKLAAKNQADQQRATATQKEEFDRYLADADKELKPDGDLALAETKINDAAKLFPAEPQVLQRRDKLDAFKSEKERAQRLTSALKIAGNFIDNGAWDDADRILKDIEELAPNNAEIAKLREKSHTLQSEALKKASEQERQKTAAALLQKFDALIADGNLAEAETRLASASELEAATSPELKNRRDLLLRKKEERKQEFEGLLRDADKSLADDSRLAEAGKKIDEAARLAPDEVRVKALREKFNQSKIAAADRERARQRHEKFAQDLKSLEESLPDAGEADATAKLAAVRGKFDELARAYENDPLIKPFMDQLDQRQTAIRHVRFLGMLKNADETMDKDLNAAEKIFTDAQTMFPMDPQLKPVRDRISTRRRFEGALGAVTDGLAHGAKLEDIEAQLAEAEKLSPNNPRTVPFREKVAGRRRDANFIALLNTAQQQMSRDETIAAAQATLNQAAKLISDDPRLTAARASLATRQADLQRRAELAGLENEVQPLLRSEISLAEAEKRIAAMEQKYPNESLYPRLRERILAQRAAFQRAAFMQKLADTVDSLLGGGESNLADAERRIRDAEQTYPSDPTYNRLRGRIAARRAELNPTPVRRDSPPVIDRRDTTRSGPNSGGGGVGEMPLDGQ